MIRQPLELQRDSPNGLRTWRLATPGERLDGAAIRLRVADHRVSGDRLRDQHRPISVHRLKEALDAAVLVAEHDFEREDLLAVALEAEVARLDDAGVHRTDRHFVDILAFDPEEGVVLPVACHELPVRGDVVGGWRRSGLSAGCPSGVTPVCSAIS